MHASKLPRPTRKTARSSAPERATPKPDNVSQPAVRASSGAHALPADFRLIQPFPQSRPRHLQAKLVMGGVDDPLERQADLAAEQALAEPAGQRAVLTPHGIALPTSLATSLPPAVQRQWSDAPQHGAATQAVTPGVAPATGWNRAETRVGTIRRIPIEGLSLGNAQPDPEAAAEEQANGRAIALIPASLSTSQPVDVLLHLHGHNIGYRQRRMQGSHPTLQPGSVRDVETDRIEQQIQASGRPMIGVLPQGTTGSAFGRINSDAYIAEVFRAFGTLGAFGAQPAPRVARVLLSGHSGAGEPLTAMLAPTGQARLPSALGEIALFDSINGDGELAAVTAWVRQHLDEDLAALTASGITTAEQQAILDTSPRFRAYFTNSNYAERHRRLQQAIASWFSQHAARFGLLAPSVTAQLRDHYQVIAVGHGHHEVIMSEQDRLLEAINALPQRTAAPPATGTTASPAAPATTTIQPKSADTQPHGFGAGVLDEAGQSRVDAALASPSQRLDAAAADFFAARFQHDFGDVRVHTGAMAADSAHALHAEAYTVGRDIVFARGRYDSATRHGRKLLAHELAHVVQQSGAPAAAAPTVQRQATPETATPLRADEAGEVLSTSQFGQFEIFVPKGVLLSARRDITNVKVHIFFAAGGVQGSDTNDVFVHGLRGASNESEWVTIGVPGILDSANTISDAQITACLQSVGINSAPVSIRLTGHSRGCDSLVRTVERHLITKPIERVVLLDEAVEHVPLNSTLPTRGSVRYNRVQVLVQNGISASSIRAYESTDKSVNLLTQQSARVRGATYFDLNGEFMAAIGAARLVEDAIALRPDIATAAAAIPSIGTLLRDLHLPPRGTFTTGPTTASKININDFCFDPLPADSPTGARRTVKASIRAILSNPVLVRFINTHNLARYSTVRDWGPLLGHEFFVAEIAHELTE